ncbi:MAG: hypothetical protein WBP93_07475 [Pyrinomonadaceae bacterium]
MKKIILSISVVLFLSAFSAQNSFAQSAPDTPAKGSTERKAILDGVRKYRKAPNEVYTPTRFKVQNGWAFVSAEDPNEPGVDTAAFNVLLRKTGKIWQVVDEVNNTEGSDWDAEIKRIRKKFPKSPVGIFQ